MLRIASLPLLLLPLLACSNSPTASGERERVFIATVLSASSSGVDRRSHEVIRDGEAWSRVWSEIHSRQFPRPALPSIDFAHEMLLLASLGERPDGCHAIAISAVERLGSRLRVVVEEGTSAATCGCTLAQVQPVHVVRLNRGTEPVHFETRRVTLPC
jgi:hypothetical protein